MTEGPWLADGVDWPPVDAQMNLYEKGEKARVITGDRAKLLSLLKIQSSEFDGLVVAGDWNSADGIAIRITSALAPGSEAKELAFQLSKKDPFQAWLPILEEHESGGEYSHSEPGLCMPWIVWPYVQSGLDRVDSLGAIETVQRLHFSKDVNAMASMRAADLFKRKWLDRKGRIMARAEAWLRNPTYGEKESTCGRRLVCNSKFLRTVLEEKGSDLLVLIILRRYDQDYGNQGRQFWHTTAVVRIGKKLDFEFFPGKINELHEK
jgi:hypothetical protein